MLAGPPAIVEDVVRIIVSTQDALVVARCRSQERPDGLRVEHDRDGGRLGELAMARGVRSFPSS